MNGEHPQPPNDAERDAWLRAALRHAPDAQVGPPAAVSERILREAKAKAKGEASARPIFIASRWWHALGRPQLGAALAGVMVAVAVGLLWRERPMEEHAPRPAAPWPSAATERAEPDTRVAMPADAGSAGAAPSAADSAERRIATAPAAPVPPPAAATAQAPAKARTQAPLTAPERAPTVDATTPATPSAEAMTAPTAPAAMATTAEPQAKAAPAERSMRRAEPLQSARQRQPAQVESVSLAELRAALTLDAARWSWRRGSAAGLEIGDRLAAWLAQADTATQQRWRRAGDPAAPGAAAADAAADELLLLQEGHVMHRLRVEGDRLHWQIAPRDGTPAAHWQAPLGAAPAVRLRQQLDEATR